MYLELDFRRLTLVVREYIKIYVILISIISLVLALVVTIGTVSAAQGLLDTRQFAFQLIFIIIFSLIMLVLATVLLGQGLQKRFLLNFIKRHGFELIDNPLFPKALSSGILPKSIEFAARGKYQRTTIEIGLLSTYKTQTQGFGIRAYKQFRFYIHWKANNYVPAKFIADEFEEVGEGRDHYLLSDATIYTEDEISNIVADCTRR